VNSVPTKAAAAEFIPPRWRGCQWQRLDRPPRGGHAGVSAGAPPSASAKMPIEHPIGTDGRPMGILARLYQAQSAKVTRLS